MFYKELIKQNAAVNQILKFQFNSQKVGMQENLRELGLLFICEGKSCWTSLWNAKLTKP